MPLYSYTCTECLIEVEELRSMADADAPLACPLCTGECTRGFSLPRLGGSRAAAGETSQPVARHPLACRCC